MTKSDDFIFELPMQVRDYEVDSQGIVNNANYLHYFEHTRHEFCRQAGTSFREMQKNGIDPVVRRVEIDYLSSLTLGEKMSSKLRMERRGPRFIFIQQIFRLPDMKPVCKAAITVVCLENERLTKGEVLADAFAKFL